MRAYLSRLVVADIVYQDIAHHIHLRQLSTLLVGNGVVADASREEYVRQSVDDQSVDLLRHGDVKRPGTRGDVSQQQPLFLGDNSCRHSRSEIIDYDYCIGGMLGQITLKLRHHLTCQFVKILTLHTKEDIWRCYLQIVKETALQRGIIGSAGIYQSTLYPTGGRECLDCSYNWGYLNEIRTSTRENTYIQCLFSFYYFSLNNSLIPPMLPMTLVASYGRYTVFVLSPLASSSII